MYGLRIKGYPLYTFGILIALRINYKILTAITALLLKVLQRFDTHMICSKAIEVCGPNPFAPTFIVPQILLFVGRTAGHAYIKSAFDADQEYIN